MFKIFKSKNKIQKSEKEFNRSNEEKSLSRPRSTLRDYEDYFDMIKHKIDYIYSKRPRVFLNYAFYESQMLILLKIRDKIMEISDHMHNPNKKVEFIIEKRFTDEIKNEYLVLNNKLKADNLIDISLFTLCIENEQAKALWELTLLMFKFYAETEEITKKEYIKTCCHYVYELQRYIIIFSGLKNYFMNVT